MARIKCVNPRCTAPGRIFTWDETAELEEGGHIAKPGEQADYDCIVKCTVCGSENKLRVIHLKRNVKGARGID